MEASDDGKLQEQNVDFAVEATKLQSTPQGGKEVSGEQVQETQRLAQPRAQTAINEEVVKDKARHSS